MAFADTSQRGPDTPRGVPQAKVPKGKQSRKKFLFYAKLSVEQLHLFYSGRRIPPGGNVFLNKFNCFIGEEAKTENFITYFLWESSRNSI